MRALLPVALRGLASRPAASAATVVTLALGMAATITFFSLMDWLLVRPVPGVRDAGDVVQIRFTTDGSSMGFGTLTIAMSYPTFEELATNLRTVGDVAGITSSPLNLGADGAALAERAEGAIVTGAYFTALGVAPARGRSLGTADSEPGAPPVAVISDRLWHERFGGGDVVGRTLRVGGQPFTIVGIGPVGFRGHATNAPVDVWLPLNEYARVASGGSIADLTDRQGRAVQRLLARAHAGGQSEEVAGAVRTDVAQVMARLAAVYPDDYRSQPDITVDVGLGIPEPLRTDVRRHGLTITAFVFLVLLVACGNAAYMLVARGVDRRHEMSVRRALGAGSFRLFRQLLGESVVLAACAGGLGWLLALWSLDLLQGVQFMSALPPVAELRLDARAAAFAAALVGLTAVVFGAGPAWLTMKAEPASALRGVGGMRQRRETRAHRLLIGAQIAIAMSIAVSALLLSRSLSHIRGSDLGFATDDVLTVAIDLDRRAYSSPAAEDFWRVLIERAAALPGVRHAAYAGTLPLGSVMTGTRLWVDGRPAPGSGVPWNVGYFVSPGYFDAMAIRLLAGRGLTRNDSAGIVIDELLARTLWPGDDPAHVVGRELIHDRTHRRTVVGVAARIATRDPTDPVHPHWYMVESGGRNGFLVVRTSRVQLSSVRRAVRALVHDLDPNVPAYDMMTMRQRVGTVLADSRTLASLLTAFGVFAVLLACFGLYGLMSYSVTTRVRELALRRVLGARGSALVRLVLVEAASLTVVAVIAGSLLARWTSGLIRARLYGVSPEEPTLYAAIAAALLLVTLLAAAVPAVRAVRVAPATALRQE